MSQLTNEKFLGAIDRLVSSSRPLSALLDKVAGRLVPQKVVQASGAGGYCYSYCGEVPCGPGRVHYGQYSVWGAPGPCNNVIYDGCIC